MNSPAYDISTHLEGSAFGLGLVGGINLFAGAEPAEPDNCVTLLDTGGLDPIFGAGGYYRPTIQVRVRDNEVTTGYTLIQAIRDALDETRVDNIGGFRYIGIWVVGDILYSHKDENDRYIHTLNFKLHRTAV